MAQSLGVLFWFPTIGFNVGYVYMALSTNIDPFRWPLTNSVIQICMEICQHLLHQEMDIVEHLNSYRMIPISLSKFVANFLFVNSQRKGSIFVIRSETMPFFSFFGPSETMRFWTTRDWNHINICMSDWYENVFIYMINKFKFTNIIKHTPNTITTR